MIADRLALGIAICLSASFCAFAQQPVGYPSSVYVSGSGRIRSPEEVEAMKRLVDAQRANERIAQLERAPNLSSDGRQTVKFKTKGNAVVSATDYLVPKKLRDRYSEFLKTPLTGIVRLFNTACHTDKNGTAKDDPPDCPGDIVPGGGSYFSFRQRDYVEYPLADVGIKDDLLFSLGSLNEAIIVRLGAIEVQDVDSGSPGMKFLWEFAPAPEIRGAAEQSEALRTGIAADGFRYSSVVSIETDSTYVVRVIAYRPYVLRPDERVKNGLRKSYVFGNDPRRDVTIAFRFIDRDKNGALTMIWKELRSMDSPEFSLSPK